MFNVVVSKYEPNKKLYELLFQYESEVVPRINEEIWNHQNDKRYKVIDIRHTIALNPDRLPILDFQFNDVNIYVTELKHPLIGVKTD